MAALNDQASSADNEPISYEDERQKRGLPVANSAPKAESIESPASGRLRGPRYSPYEENRGLVSSRIRRPRRPEEKAMTEPPKSEAASVTMREYVDAKIEGVSAKNDARFNEVISKLDTLQSDVSRIPSLWGFLGLALATVVTGIGILLGLLSYAGDRFDGGMQAASVSVYQANEALQVAGDNAKQVEALNSKMDTIIQILGEKAQE